MAEPGDPEEGALSHLKRVVRLPKEVNTELTARKFEGAVASEKDETFRLLPVLVLSL